MAMINASVLRSPWRTLLPIMANVSLSAQPSSDPVVVVMSSPSCQREEDVVERRAVERETLDRDAVRREMVKHPLDVRRRPVRGDGDQSGVSICGHAVTVEQR